MNQIIVPFFLLLQVTLFALIQPVPADAASMEEAEEAEPEKGPHRGRMLRDGDFAIELAIFETGVPPEFRVWATNGGAAIDPSEINLRVQLTRLGNVVDDIGFNAEGDYLRGDTVIYEPHSFLVTVRAQYQGQSHSWEYENFEGRTAIADNVADAMEIRTESAGQAVLHQTIRVYGKLVLPPDAMRKVQARFDGEIKKVHVGLGDEVKQGQPLITVESNESLQTYAIHSSINGVVTERIANVGEQTAGRTLLEIVDLSVVTAELAVYPADSDRVQVDAPVEIRVVGSDQSYSTVISGSRMSVRDDQARLYLANIDNAAGLLNDGQFLVADVEVETIPVPLAVKRTGLQGFRDFTVVYAKVGQEYEVRMLDLGRVAGPWVEVLGGLEPGTEYVTENSYILKADIEKSGASHDH